MTLPFALRHAAREARSSARRLGVYMLTITIGVAALVAVNGYRTSAIRSLDAEARALLGADLRLAADNPFADSVGAVLDSAAAADVPVSRVTSTVTMALSPAGRTRIVQLRAIDGGYPYYGAVETVPAGQWPRLQAGGTAIVEPAVLQALDAQVGDSIRIGERWFRIAASAPSMPPELSFRSAIGPRVFIAGADLASTGLIGFGSLVRYEAFLAFDDGGPRELLRDHRELFRRAGVSVETASEQARDIARGLDTFGRFLGLVGLVALLLGGLGVASAVHVFVADKRATVATLRCLGATRRTTFAAYLTQAALLGLAGALAGVLLGIAVQALLPRLLAGAVPFRTSFMLDWTGILAGLATGVWVATAFALLPLLEIRRVTPLAALRHDVEPRQVPARRDPPRIAALLAILASVVLLAVWQAPEPDQGIGFAAGIAATLLVLWAAARLAIAITRRLRPRRAAFTLRHGISNVFRPHNQTAAVTIALGFGVFLVVALWVVQHALIRSFAPGGPEEQPNLVAFDIQPHQREGVVAQLEAAGATYLNVVPIVTARIAALNGVPADSILANRRAYRVERWALRREYRNTFRDSLTESETLVAGEWWTDRRAIAGTAAAAGATTPRVSRAPRAGDGLPRISVEQDVARDLGLSLGDRVTWDVHGVPIETRVTSLRAVEWHRFDTNFFVVFEPGVLDQAPQMLVAVANVPEPAARAAVQRDIVLRSPNVSLIDVGTVQATLDRIIGQVTLAIRFMALFCVAAGVVVLIGAISASRFQRMRESVLLRTLGATRAQVRRIMLVEYAVLGAMAALVGCALGTLAGWALLAGVFDLPFRPPLGAVALAGLTVIALAVIVGFANGREALRRTPLAALREADA